MDSIKIIHTADLHLGSGRTAVKNGKAEIENTFFKIIDLCETQKVDFLLIAGDLFDTPFVSPDLFEKVSSAISKVPETTVVISPGNHDCACPGSVYLKYDFPKNTVIFSSFLEYVDFPEKKTRIFGAGFTDRFESLPLLHTPDDINPGFINICVLHGELTATTAQSTYNPIPPSAIEDSGFDYIALGHIHKRSNIEVLGSTRFSYCGCPDGMGFDDTGSRGIYLGNISKTECNLEYMELSSRQYILESFNISSFNNSFEISDALFKHIKDSSPDRFSDNIYRITLVGDIPSDMTIELSQIKSILAEKLFYLELIDGTTTNLLDVERFKDEPSLRGIFVKKMLEKIENAAPGERQLYKDALKFGLNSFTKGVSLDDY